MRGGHRSALKCMGSLRGERIAKSQTRSSMTGMDGGRVTISKFGPKPHKFKGTCIASCIGVRFFFWGGWLENRVPPTHSASSTGKELKRAGIRLQDALYVYECIPCELRLLTYYDDLTSLSSRFSTAFKYFRERAVPSQSSPAKSHLGKQLLGKQVPPRRYRAKNIFK